MTLQRRQILGGGLALLTAGGAALAAKTLGQRFVPADLKGLQTEAADDEPVTAAAGPWAKEDVRRAYVHNLHTGEMLNAVYYANGRYMPGVLAEAKHILRDWRNNQQHFIDPHVFDLLHNLRCKI